MRPRTSTVAHLAICFAIACSGCRAQRELRIKTVPPDAVVRVDDAIVGEGPVTIPFEHYGTRRVAVYREGYRTASREIALRTPWYSVFPLDLFSEILLPFGWADVRRVEIELEPEVGEVSEAEFRAVLDRADALRRAGPAGPRPAPPPPETTGEGAAAAAASGEGG